MKRNKSTKGHLKRTLKNFISNQNKTKTNFAIFLTSIFVIFYTFSFLNFINFKGFSSFAPQSQADINIVSQNFNPTEQLQTDTSNSADRNNGTTNADNPQYNKLENQYEKENENTKITNTSTCVSVGEIWNDTTKQFKKNELLQLIKYASNKTITIDNISAIKNLTINANTMRSYNSSKDIIVTLGGLQWTVTYLSQDKKGNSVLTLWLANSTQLSGKNVYSNNGSPTTTPIVTTFNSNATTKWNSGFSPYDTPTSAYPDNLYGTSYMRAVVLNNGGTYTISTGGGSFATIDKTKMSNSIFSKFTIQTDDETAIADYIVTPVDVSWQEHQSYKELKVNPSYPYDLPNDGWETGQSNGNYYTKSGVGNYNYSNKDKYSTWKDDLLWLPSLTETGWRDGDRIGLWWTSTNQRSNTGDYSWLRSGIDCTPCGANHADTLYPAGNNYTDQVVSNYFSVRPALHLNLDTAVESTKNIWGYKQFVSENLNYLLKYLIGTNTTATNASLLSSLNSLIGSETLNSSQIVNNANKITDKIFFNKNNEFVIRLGVLKWYGTYLSKSDNNIILTMYLANSEQLQNRKKSNNARYNTLGSASWNSGSSPYSNGSTIISNNYGNSNIRNLFSTASTTTNTASVFYPYLKTTTNITAIGDFIVAPKDLNTQDAQNLQKTQSAKSTLGFRYNLPNESFSTLINYSNTYKNLSLSASTTNYTSWQNDKLWLPSLSEVGLGTNNTISTNSTTSNNLRTCGLWGLSTSQRSNTNKTATWLRSGHITDKNLAYTISSDGLDYGYETIDTQNGIRPALHLNLTLACQYVS